MARRNNFLYWCMLVIAADLLTGFTTSSAAAVMPPAHYDTLVQSSAIKAIAFVQEVKILEETKRSSRKEVFFRLVKAFGNDVPRQFRGTCYSVDHERQNPGVGGTIYYYPQKETKVLVTVSSDGGFITSYTLLSPELEQEVTVNGLTNISFALGRASVKRMEKEHSIKQWFTFKLEGKRVGYLALSHKQDSANKLSIEFTQELLVGELDGERTLYTIMTQVREDNPLTPEMITLDVIRATAENTAELSQKEYSFRSVDAAHTTDGILVKGDNGTVDIAIPSETTTDFLLFSLVEKMPFEADSVMHINLIETMEMHLKKGVMIRYAGRDSQMKNLHRFEETGPAQATYWLNGSHELQEVHWDRDKVFLRTTESEATTILQ